MFNKKSIATAVLMASMSLSVSAIETDAIDKTTSDCMEKNYSTVGMQECSKAAYKQWDEALNTIYAQLEKDPKTGAEGVATLKESQRNWLKFRDSEAQFINKFYSNQEGTYWGTIAGDMKLEAIRIRVKTLQSYLESLNPAG
jgi:uncharacterized protein YecT (DUF1311 family)